jgi:aspartate/methionine/tyrosine aminotransferase
MGCNSKINPQAEELNDKIRKANPAVMEMLSERGKAAFFPKKGILGQTAEAKGKDINATIGIALEEDGSPMRLNSVASSINLEPKDAFPYAPSFGKPELRGKWKSMLYEKNPSLEGKEISLPVVTNALTHGLSMAGYLFANAGDTIIVPDLFWGNYKLIFENTYGAKLETFKFFDNNSFNANEFEKALSAESPKKIVLLNFPNNPSGYTVTEDEASDITAIIKKSAENSKVVMLIDDAYFGLVFEEGVLKESIFAFLADIHKNVLAVKVDGATKEDYVWGLRVGFVTYGIGGDNEGKHEVYAALESKTAGAVRGTISNAPHLSQSIVLKAFSSPSYHNEKREKFNIIRRRYCAVKELLEKQKEYAEYFEALPFNSGYFMCIRLKKNNAEDVRKRLLEKYSTGVIALGNLLRLAFSATPASKIPLLFENIYNACREV